MISLFMATMFATAPASVPDPIRLLQWTPLAKSVSAATVAPDGTLWALGTTKAGGNEHLLRYADNAWTETGVGASSVAVSPTGTVYISQYPDRIYESAGGSAWKLISRANVDGLISTANGALYGLGKVVDSRGDRGVWKEATGGSWVQQPGKAIKLVASLDPLSYSVPAVGAVKPGGYFEIESSGQGFYESPGSALVKLPGSIKSIAPVFGGYYEVEKATGTLAYFDYTTAATTSTSTAVDEILSGVGEFGPWQQLYVTEGGALSESPVTTAIAGEPVATEFAVPSKYGPPAEIVLGPDGNLWFTEIDLSTSTTGKYIGKITEDGKISEYLPPHGIGGGSIAAGVDAVWFSEQNGFIAKITPAGKITEYGETGIVLADPKKIIWLQDGAQLSELSSNGTVVKTYQPRGPGMTGSLAVDRYHNAWYGIQGTSVRDPDLLEEATPTGIFKNYQLIFTPFGVTVGPDGDSYVATVEMGDGSLAVQKITPAGQNIYLYPKDYGLYMAVGPDGAIWSADGGGNVARLTIDGTFTKYAATADEEFAPSITGGPDDTVWFTEQPSNKIVRVQLR